MPLLCEFAVSLKMVQSRSRVQGPLCLGRFGGPYIFPMIRLVLPEKVATRLRLSRDHGLEFRGDSFAW